MSSKWNLLKKSLGSSLSKVDNEARVGIDRTETVFDIKGFIDLFIVNNAIKFEWEPFEINTNLLANTINTKSDVLEDSDSELNNNLLSIQKLIDQKLELIGLNDYIFKFQHFQNPDAKQLFTEFIKGSRIKVIYINLISWLIN